MPTKHVVDTHALVWHLEDNPRLGPSAKVVMADPACELVLPIIALAEACWLVEHGKSLIPTVQDLLAVVDADPRVEIVPLDREILDKSLALTVIDEMHDRQIVASALVLKDKGAAVAVLTRDMHDRQIVASALVLKDKGAAVAVLTRDQVIQASGLVPVIW